MYKTWFLYISNTRVLRIYRLEKLEERDKREKQVGKWEAVRDVSWGLLESGCKAKLVQMKVISYNIRGLGGELRRGS